MDPCGYQNQSIESVSDTVRRNSSTETPNGVFAVPHKETQVKPNRTFVLAVLTFGLGYQAAAQKDFVRVNSKEAPPRPGAPYNQGVMVGNLIWLSGNVGQDPATQKVSPDFAVEARQSIRNLEAVLKAADLSLADVVKTNVYVTDVAKYDAFNAIYVEMMPKPLPARTFVGVAALPSGAQIEIEFVAARK
jgi:2-iminobutanoate/2-iminopropanoate deaminase